ncbi:response regulator [Sphingomonas canadensis]|uniref:Response regulator n=1 Tax=Sphingomonas canadensis TaxID=1219257 RepID=A0ABW3H5S3_9SPHN|nr:response regulator [Sphingomonas canadensis]MCW3835114.1 response regulator [Sphingomonas canadensis]
MSSVRVLIVDDSLTIRAMLEEVLGREPDIILLGSAADAQSAARMVRELHPDVVTLDIAMPGTDGLALLDAVHESTHAVMLTSRSDAVEESYARGAFGYFEKSRILRESKRLVQMVRAAAAGRKSRRPVLHPAG